MLIEWFSIIVQTTCTYHYLQIIGQCIQNFFLFLGGGGGGGGGEGGMPPESPGKCVQY